MNKDATVFLRHILESIELLEKYTKDVTEEQFLRSVEKQDLVTRRLEINCLGYCDNKHSRIQRTG